MDLSLVILSAVSRMNFTAMFLYSLLDPIAGLLCVPFQVWCDIGVAMNALTWKYYIEEDDEKVAKDDAGEAEE